jgi:NADH-quinone oxidoreductase subunit G
VRWEAPLVNTRIRKAIKKGAKVFAIGAGDRPDLQGRPGSGNDTGAAGKLPKSVLDAFAAHSVRR